MHERLVSGLLLVVAAIHLLPLAGLLGVDRLAALYDVEIVDPNLEILMRHRAVLFGILGGFIGIAALRIEFHVAAIVMALVSIVSFLYLSLSVGGYNSAIRTVVVVDLAALALLLAAIALHIFNR